MRFRAALSFLLLIALALPGCAKDEKGQRRPLITGTAESQKIDPAMLQRDVMSFCDRFVTAVADSFDQLAASAKTSEARQMAMGRKVGHTVAALGCAADESPIVGMMDLLVLTRLVRQASEDLWFTEMFGEEGRKTTTVLSAQEHDIWSVAAKHFTAPQLGELSDSIDRWRRDNPDQRYVALVRLSSFPEAKNAGGGWGNNKGPGSIFGLLFLDPFASLDPAVRQVERSRETVERMFFYMQRMPVIMSWQVQLVYQQMISDPEITQFVTNTDKFTTSTLRFADATGEVARSVKDFPKFMTEERERSVVQLSKEVAVQREVAVKEVAQAVAAEREAAIKQLDTAVASQRDAAIRQVAETFSAQRDATIAQATTQFSQERDETLEKLKSSIETQRQGLVSDVQTMTALVEDRLFWRGMTLLVTAIVLTLLAAIAYRLVCGPPRGGTAGQLKAET